MSITDHRSHVYNRKWLAHSSDSSIMEFRAEQLAAFNNPSLSLSLSRRIDFLTRKPDQNDYRAHTLDVILTSVFWLYLSILFSPILVYRTIVISHHPLQSTTLLKTHFDAKIQPTGMVSVTS